MMVRNISSVFSKKISGVSSIALVAATFAFTTQAWGADEEFRTAVGAKSSVQALAARFSGDTDTVTSKQHTRITKELNWLRKQALLTGEEETSLEAIIKTLAEKNGVPNTEEEGDTPTEAELLSGLQEAVSSIDPESQATLGTLYVRFMSLLNAEDGEEIDEGVDVSILMILVGMFEAEQEFQTEQPFRILTNRELNLGEKEDFAKSVLQAFFLTEVLESFISPENKEAVSSKLPNITTLFLRETHQEQESARLIEEGRVAHRKNLQVALGEIGETAEAFQLRQAEKIRLQAEAEIEQRIQAEYAAADLQARLDVEAAARTEAEERAEAARIEAEKVAAQRIAELEQQLRAAAEREEAARASAEREEAAMAAEPAEEDEDWVNVRREQESASNRQNILRWGWSKVTGLFGRE